MAGTYSETVGGVQSFYGYIYSGSDHTITKVEYPGAVSTFVTAISSMGTVVAGTASVGANSPAFVYRSSTFRKIRSSTLDANRLQPKTVNNSGYVTGQYLNSSFQTRSFTAAGLAVDFAATKSGAACTIAGMNPPGNRLVGTCGAQGMITNGSAVNTYNVGGSASQTTLGAISVQDIVAGSALTPQGTMVFSSDGDTVTNSALVPANWGMTGVSGINAATKIVGAFLDTNDNTLKAFWAH